VREREIEGGRESVRAGGGVQRESKRVEERKQCWKRREVNQKEADGKLEEMREER
jgi:hypothetical protein